MDRNKDGGSGKNLWDYMDGKGKQGPMDERSTAPQGNCDKPKKD